MPWPQPDSGSGMQCHSTVGFDVGRTGGRPLNYDISLV